MPVTAVKNEAPSCVVAFQGAHGAYSEEAITTVWDGHAQPQAVRTFLEVIEAVHTGTVDYGVLPVENTIVGPIAAVAQALAHAKSRESGITVISETTVDIRHTLLAPRGATLRTITHVSSHPVALAQCRGFFSKHPHLTALEFYDTAGAAQQVAQDGDIAAAAIAGIRSARLYNLNILAEDIQDVPTNQTRFAVIAKNRGDRW